MCGVRLSMGSVGFGGLAVSLRFFTGEFWQPFGVVEIAALLGDKALCRQEKNTNEENGAQNKHYIGGPGLSQYCDKLRQCKKISKIPRMCLNACFDLSQYCDKMSLTRFSFVCSKIVSMPESACRNIATSHVSYLLDS